MSERNFWRRIVGRLVKVPRVEVLDGTREWPLDGQGRGARDGDFIRYKSASGKQTIGQVVRYAGALYNNDEEYACQTFMVRDDDGSEHRVVDRRGDYVEYVSGGNAFFL